MKFNAIRDFIAVVDRGGLRAAARQLNGSQPAITRSIQELERELGVVLFDRKPGGVALTPMGAVFHRRASSVLNELRLAQEELDQLRGETYGSLRVAMSSVPHIALLPNSLRPFRARFPNVIIDIIDAVFPKIELDLRESRVDLYVGPVPSDISSELVSEKLFDNTRVIVGRKGHPLAQAKSLRDLVGAEWITTSITHLAEEELGPLFENHGLPAPKLVLQAHSTLTFLTVLMSTDLLMMLPIQWTQSPVLGEFVQSICVQETLPAPPMCLVRKTGMPLTPAAEYFSDMLRRAVLHMQSGPRVSG